MDFWAEDIKVKKHSLEFKVFSKDGDSAVFKTKLIGAHNILNILAAVSTAKELGMDLKEISKVFQKIKPLENTMQLKQGREGIMVVDDTYSANPKGVEAALNYLKIYQGKKVIVMPCLIELGKASKRVHRRIGREIGQVCNLAIITTPDYFPEIKKGVQSAGFNREQILLLQEPNRIFEKIKPYLKPENVILLEGRVPEKLVCFLEKF